MCLIFVVAVRVTGHTKIVRNFYMEKLKPTLAAVSSYNFLESCMDSLLGGDFVVFIRGYYEMVNDSISDTVIYIGNTSFLLSNITAFI